MNQLELQLKNALSERRNNGNFRQLVVNCPDAIDFYSNDFLGLSRSKRMRNDFLNELSSMPSLFGSTGSRLLSGNSEYVNNLEQQIAAYHGMPSALIFNSGYDANFSLFSTLPQIGDIVLYDELIHASVREGLRYTRASHRIPFIHSNIANLAMHIDNFKDTKHNVFIAVETVYSMDGDIAPLVQIVKLIRSYWRNGENGFLIVDEAHSTGVYGENGRGLVSELGLEKMIFARLHTFSKALASSGAVIVGSATLRQYLINYSRNFIYSTFMSFSSLAMVKIAYKQLQSDETLKTQIHLQKLIARFRDSISLGFGKLLPSSTPIQVIVLSGCKAVRALANHLDQRGFTVKPICSPTVPLGQERIRICLHGHNSLNQVDDFVKSILDFFTVFHLESRL